MKGTFLLIVALLTSFSIDAQKYFKVLEATSVTFSGGMPQSGSGTSYIVKAVLLTGREIRFTDAWSGRRVQFTEAWTAGEYAAPDAISFSHTDGRPLTKGDTILIRFTIRHYPPESPMKASLPVYKAPPVPIKGEALIRYVVGNSEKYLSVPKFKQQPPISYP